MLIVGDTFEIVNIFTLHSLWPSGVWLALSQGHFLSYDISISQALVPSLFRYVASLNIERMFNYQNVGLANMATAFNKKV